LYVDVVYRETDGVVKISLLEADHSLW